MNRPFWGLLVLALLLRGAYALTLPNALLLPDAASFDTIAWNLAFTNQFASDQGRTASRPPSYVIFLALIYRVIGHHYLAARVVQGIFGTLLVFILMKMSRYVSPSTSMPWITGLLAAVYPFFIYYDAQLISETFMTFWLCSGILLFWLWQDDPLSWTKATACGLALAILSLSKTIFIPLSLLWLLIDSCIHVSDHPPLARWQRTATIAFFLIAPCLLWSLRNQRLFGRYLIDSHGGYTTLGTIVNYAHVKDGTYGDFIKTQPIWIENQNLNEAQQDVVFMNATRSFIREHPGQFMRQSLGNFKNLWRFYPRQDVQFKEGSRLLTWVSLLTEPFLIILGCIGVYQTRHQWKRLYPLYTSVLFLTLIYTLITGQMRYRLPLMPFFILWASAVLSRLGHSQEDLFPATPRPTTI